MKMDITIDRKKLEKILKNADPAKVKSHTEKMIKYAGHHGYAVAKKNISGGSEQAKISIRFDYTVSDMTAKVHSVMPAARAMSIEEGRKPGENLSYLQIARWVTGRRYMQTRHAASLTREQKAQIESVIESIRSRGTQGKKFISGAHEAVNRDMPKILDALANKIESEWNK